MESIQDAVGHFGQGARLLEESMGRIMELWTQMERMHVAQQSAEARWQQMEQRLNAVMEERWRQLEERLETMVVERVETLAQQRLEDMIAQGVEAKVGERLDRMEHKLMEQNRDGERGEASPVAGKIENAVAGCGDGAINVRLASLENSVHKALQVMFPRVETLLTQIEEQSLIVQGVGKSVEPVSSEIPVTSAVPHLPSHSKCSAAADGNRARHQRRASKLELLVSLSSLPPRSSIASVPPALCHFPYPPFLSSSTTPEPVRSSLSVCNAHVAPGVPAGGDAAAIASPTSTITSLSTSDDNDVDGADSTNLYAVDFPLTSQATSSRVSCSVDSLMGAAKEGNTLEVEVHLDAGMPINTCDSYGNTALYWTTFKGHVRTMGVLIARGADANCRNHEGWTPLHAAARWGFVSGMTLLLDAGAAIEGKTETGNTPLHVAAHAARSEAVRLLLVEGARLDVRNNQGNTPLGLANSTAVRRLLRR